MRWLEVIIVIALLVVVVVLLRPMWAAAELLATGTMAPDFSTQMVTADGTKPVKLSDFRGKTVILYFYPKDQTPGCTKEACAFRDGYAKLSQAGIVVLGCSVQDADSHTAFIKKYNLPFPLLVDPDKKIATAYGAANGIPALGLDRRITYVIDPQGKIEKVYPKVDPSTHASEIIAAFAASAPKPAQAAPAPGAGSPGGE
jgi:thioredoxin-dependent peroxiredoxin